MIESTAPERPAPRDVYLDTSLVVAAMIVGSPHHRAARAYCERLTLERSNVYFSQFLRVELLQAIRSIATDPDALPGVIRRRNRLGKWGFDDQARRAWFAYGTAQFEQLMSQFDTVLELPFTLEAWRRCAAIMWRHQIKSYDAFHAATALEHGVRTFASLDKHFSRVAGLRVELVRNSVE